MVRTVLNGIKQVALFPLQLVAALFMWLTLAFGSIFIVLDGLVTKWGE